MSLALFFAQHISNASTFIFRSLRLTVDLFHELYCSGSVCVGVTVWFGWGGVVSLCRLKQRFNLHNGLSLFNYQDDARPNKLKIHSLFGLVNQSMHVGGIFCGLSKVLGV